jgi:hypothetical protein
MPKYYVDMERIPDYSLSTDPERVFGDPERFSVDLTEEEYRDFVEASRRYGRWIDRIRRAVNYPPDD